MKIAIIVPFFPPKWVAGTEIATYNIAKYLTAKGNEVHIITSFDKGLPEEYIEQGFFVHRIKHLVKIKFLGAIFIWLKMVFVIKRINPDIVHVQGVSAAPPALLAKKFLKKPYVVWGRGSEVYLFWRFKTVISKLVLNNANAVISLTEDMKAELKKVCKKEIYVIPNGIDLEKFKNLSKKDARSELNIADKEKIILLVGGLRPVKGVRYLIKAMEIIKQKSTGIRLLLVGDGDERQTLERQAKELDLTDCVTFVGKVANENVQKYMAAADIFVLPSLSEGFPVVILEAMASGLPVIATKVRGVPEIVKIGENGFLVDPKNPEQIAEKALSFFEDDKLRGIISENNKEKVKKYNWKSVVGRLEEVYCKILNY